MITILSFVACYMSTVRHDSSQNKSDGNVDDAITEKSEVEGVTESKDDNDVNEDEDNVKMKKWK